MLKMRLELVVTALPGVSLWVGRSISKWVQRFAYVDAKKGKKLDLVLKTSYASEPIFIKLPGQRNMKLIVII
jgi:hypothetical protein